MMKIIRHTKQRENVMNPHIPLIQLQLIENDSLKTTLIWFS